MNQDIAISACALFLVLYLMYLYIFPGAYSMSLSVVLRLLAVLGHYVLY